MYQKFLLWGSKYFNKIEINYSGVQYIWTGGIKNGAPLLVWQSLLCKGTMWAQEYGVLLLNYEANELQDLRFTKICTAAHKIYGLLCVGPLILSHEFIYTRILITSYMNLQNLLLHWMVTIYRYAVNNY